MIKARDYERRPMRARAIKRHAADPIEGGRIALGEGEEKSD